MKKLLLFPSMVLVLTINIFAQSDSIHKTTFVERNLGGPRLGLTYIADNGELTQSFKGKNLGRLISQFGWLFEYQVIPKSEAPTFLVQFSAMVSGVEQGVFYPNIALVMGLRTFDGYELGLGPNIMLGSGMISHSALMVGIGKNFMYGDVNIPVNLSISTSPKGTRVNFTFGYAIAKAK